MTEKLIEKRILKTYQTDRFGVIRPLMLMNELQALADNHAELLGCGRSYCIEHGIAWVVTHYLIDIIELPREHEELSFITWPSAHDVLKAVRDFEIRGADGRLMVRATSQWIVIDIEKRRPIKLEGNLPINWSVITERAYDRAFEKFPDFVSQKSRDWDCRYDDVDVNQHINNAVYAVWATESVGFEFRNTHKLRGIELNFKKEISPDTATVTVDVSLEPSPPCGHPSVGGEYNSRHKIRTGDVENANVICYWK